MRSNKSIMWILKWKTFCYHRMRCLKFKRSISPNTQCLFRWPQNVRTKWWKPEFIATSKARNDVKWNPTVWIERISLVRIFCATFCIFISNGRKPVTVNASRFGLIFNEIDNFRCRGTSCLFIILYLLVDERRRVPSLNNKFAGNKWDIAMLAHT